MRKSFFADKPLPPAPATLGWELMEEWPEEGRIKVSFLANETMLNARGAIQGGFVAAMLDDVMGPALIVLTDGTEAPVTIDMNVTFIRPTLPGRVIGIGRVISKTKTMAFLEAELFDADNRLLARATSSARIVPV